MLRLCIHRLSRLRWDLHLFACQQAMVGSPPFHRLPTAAQPCTANDKTKQQSLRDRRPQTCISLARDRPEPLPLRGAHSVRGSGWPTGDSCSSRPPAMPSWGRSATPRAPAGASSQQPQAVVPSRTYLGNAGRPTFILRWEALPKGGVEGLLAALRTLQDSRNACVALQRYGTVHLEQQCGHCTTSTYRPLQGNENLGLSEPLGS